ncbi:hypothetical protein ACP4OV_007091 [Aristida adscensionis]
MADSDPGVSSVAPVAFNGPPIKVYIPRQLMLRVAVRRLRGCDLKVVCSDYEKPFRGWASVLVPRRGTWLEGPLELVTACGEYGNTREEALENAAEALIFTLQDCRDIVIDDMNLAVTSGKDRCTELRATVRDLLLHLERTVDDVEKAQDAVEDICAYSLTGDPDADIASLASDTATWLNGVSFEGRGYLRDMKQFQP